jgi:hypothetical protein
MNTSSNRSALAVAALYFVLCAVKTASACDAGCAPMPMAFAYNVAPVSYEEFDHSPAHSWVFKRSTYTNDPETGARVGQYARIEPVEALDDQRLVTSSYRRMRSENRGRDGSMDNTYVVQAWGNGGGGIDAEWQMFNDVWKESILSGSFYNGEQAAGPWGDRGNNGWNGGWGDGGWNNGWNGGGWNGGGPGWGSPGWGGGWNGPGNGGNWNGGNWNGGGNWNQGGWRKRDGHWPSDNRRPLTESFP